jgi:maltose/maltodextrin transport system substrate-binding protein/arabinogalactan oligomer/maltooligosaccharide transport system substrate-binding protein
MKRFATLTSVVVFMMLLSVLTACGAATPAPAEPAEPAKPAEEPKEEAQAEPTKAAEKPAEAPAATLVIWADEIRSPILNEIGKSFQEATGVAVNVQLVAFDDIRSRLTVAAPAGQGPDIFIGAHDWQGELVKSGILAPLDLGAKKDQFLPVAVSAFTYEGQLNGLPYATENIALLRNKELVPDAPKTWEEVEKIATELEKSGKVKNGYLIQEGDPYHYYPIHSAFGGYVFGKDDKGSYDPTDVGIDSEGGLAAASWLEKMVKDKHLIGGIDWDTLHVAFENGDAAMIITGPWALERIRKSGVPYAVSVIPAGVKEAAPFMGVQGFMINNFSKNKLLAQEFLVNFIATEEVMQQMYNTDPRPSAFIAVRDKIDDPDLAAFAEAGVNADPMPAIPEMGAVWDAWRNGITLILNGQSSGPDASKTAADQIRTAIGSAK